MNTSFDRSLTLFELNWLPALYAQPVWWNAWAPHRREPVSGLQRLVHRVSDELLRAHRLLERFGDERNTPAWLLWPDAALDAAAHRIGRIALAQRVRGALGRAQVLRTIDLLGGSGRDDALADALRWPALSATLHESHPLPNSTTDVTRLGARVLCGLLDDKKTGLRERLGFRFADAHADPIALSVAQRDEAQACLAALPRPGINTT
jgi:hypothetical protein